MIALLTPERDRTLIRFTIYSFAAMMDVILSSVLFVCAVRLAEMTGSSTATGGLFALWAGVYILSSLAAGQVTSRRNVGPILIAACLLTGALAGGYVRWPGLRAMYVLIAMQGVAAAFFFTPFQVFIKLVDEGQKKSVARSSGLYVFSWSMGFALGPFIAGFLWKYGWEVSHLFNAAVAVVMAVGIFLLKHHAGGPSGPAVRPISDGAGVLPVADVSAPCPLPGLEHSPGTEQCGPAGHVSEGGRETPPPGKAACPLPDLAWMAWIFCGLGCMLATMIRSHFPVTGEFFSVSKPNQGLVLCLMSGTQAVVGFLLGWSRTWMYRPWPVVGFGLFGVVGLALFAEGEGVDLFWPAAVCFGVYAGSFYFYFVYHALIHPTRSARYVSINEAVAGVAGMAGPALGGVVADRFGLWVPYLVGAGMVLVGCTVQAWLHQRWGGGRVARL